MTHEHASDANSCEHTNAQWHRKKHYSNDSKTQKHTATAKLFLHGPCNVVFGNVKKRLATQETKFKAACKPEKNQSPTKPSKNKNRTPLKREPTAQLMVLFLHQVV
jgi:hypothetical protein